VNPPKLQIRLGRIRLREASFQRAGTFFEEANRLVARIILLFGGGGKANDLVRLDSFQAAEILRLIGNNLL
jgi:hypothetical protein